MGTDNNHSRKKGYPWKNTPMILLRVQNTAINWNFAKSDHIVLHGSAGKQSAYFMILRLADSGTYMVCRSYGTFFSKFLI